MQERDGGNPAWSLPRLLVSILLARGIGAALLPVAGCVCRWPRCAARDRGWLGLSRKSPVVRCRDGHADQLLDVAKIGRLFGVAERDRDTCRAGPRGAADAMHIGFRHVWQIEIHDVADAVDVDTACGNVGGD